MLHLSIFRKGLTQQITIANQCKNIARSLCSPSGGSAPDSESKLGEDQKESVEKKSTLEKQTERPELNWSTRAKFQRPEQHDIELKATANKKVKQSAIGRQLIQAAKDVANHIGGNKQNTITELLTGIEKYRRPTVKAVQPQDRYNREILGNTSSYMQRAQDNEKRTEDVIEQTRLTKVYRIPAKERTVQQNGGTGFMRTHAHEITSPKLSHKSEKNFANVSDYVKRRIKDDTLGAENPNRGKSSSGHTNNVQQYISKRLGFNVPKPDKRRRVLNDKTAEFQLSVNDAQWNTILHFEHFPRQRTSNTQIPNLKMWNLFEKRYIRHASLHSPENGFEEMIQLTDENKLWKFPIDNEEGMEAEHNVHFSKHVFLEQHLQEWCPRLGPIRHFMELVCIGLSKNPHMKVEEKLKHITWYKNYFAQHQKLLTELGALPEPSVSTENSEKQRIEV